MPKPQLRYVVDDIAADTARLLDRDSRTKAVRRERAELLVLEIAKLRAQVRDTNIENEMLWNALFRKEMK